MIFCIQVTLEEPEELVPPVLLEQLDHEEVAVQQVPPDCRDVSETQGYREEMEILVLLEFRVCVDSILEFEITLDY